MMRTRKPSQMATCKSRGKRAAYRMQAEDMRHAPNGELRKLSTHGHAPHPAQSYATHTMHNATPWAQLHTMHAYRITAKSGRPGQPPCVVGFARCERWKRSVATTVVSSVVSTACQVRDKTITMRCFSPQKASPPCLELELMRARGSEHSARHGTRPHKSLARSHVAACMLAWKT